VNQAAAELIDPETLSNDELVAAACRAGNLSWMLHSAQKAIYDKYRAWEQVRQNDESSPKAGTYPRIFCIAKSGRFGGSTLSLLIKTEDCIRNPGQSHRISSAFQKNIAEIVNDVSHVVFDLMPDDVKPVYKGSQGPQGPGFYFPLQPGFTRQSVIRLIGLDLHPDGSRGQASDGDVFTEAGYIVKLLYVVKNVVYRQYQGRPWASMILETSAPNVIDTDWERIFLPDAVSRGAAAFATIEDNPLLSRYEKDEFIAAMGGRGHPDCEREYFNVIAVDQASRVVPEWDELRHVQEWPTPEYAHCYVTADPGTRDLFGLLWGYWDFGRAALYFQRDWAEPNALNNDVAAAVREGEQELWGTPGIAGELVDPKAFRVARKPGVGPDVEVIDRWLPAVGAPAGTLCWYDGKWLRANPYHRISDIDLPLCAQLSSEHRLEFNSIVKSSKEAMANSFRDAVSNGKVIAHPRCVKLNAHLKAARWNKKRTDWERATAHGHFDLLACAIYMWWWVKDYCHLNPNAPYRPLAQPGQQVIDQLPWQKRPEQQQMEAVRIALGQDRKLKPGRMRVARR
jgi:hypothetical protein